MCQRDEISAEAFHNPGVTIPLTRCLRVVITRTNAGNTCECFRESVRRPVRFVGIAEIQGRGYGGARDWTWMILAIFAIAYASLAVRRDGKQESK